MPAEDPERRMYLGFIKVRSLTFLSLISVPFMSAPFTSKHRSAPRPAVPRKMYPLPTIATEAFLAQSLSALNRDLALNNFSVEEVSCLGTCLSCHRIQPQTPTSLTTSAAPCMPP